AMYVAAAPGSQVATPTAKQFKALKKEVTKLQKQVKKVQKETVATQQDLGLVGTVIFACMLNQTVGVTQNGDTSGAGAFGYSYTDNQGNSSMMTALDVAGTAVTPDSTLLTLNPDPNLDCSQLVGLPLLQHQSVSARQLSALLSKR